MMAEITPPFGNEKDPGKRAGAPKLVAPNVSDQTWRRIFHSDVLVQAAFAGRAGTFCEPQGNPVVDRIVGPFADGFIRITLRALDVVRQLIEETPNRGLRLGLSKVFHAGNRHQITRFAFRASSIRVFLKQSALPSWFVA